MFIIYQVRIICLKAFALCLMLMPYILPAQNISIRNAENVFKVRNSNYSRLNISNSLNKIYSRNISTPSGDFAELNIADYSHSNTVGAPKLPVLRKLIEMPIGAKVKVRIINKNVSEVSLKQLGIDKPIIPCQPPVSKDSARPAHIFRINKNIYEINDFIKPENELISVKYLGIMRGISIAIISINPVEYNPKSKSLRITDNIDAEITFEDADISETIRLKKQMNSTAFSKSFYNLINFNNNSSFGSAAYNTPVKYVIVSDPMFKETLAPFIAWKKNCGYNIIEAYTDNPEVGKTNTSIKNYLKKIYDNASDVNPPQSFVLLVGDVDQIPAFKGVASDYYYFTDLYYVEYTGDFLPDALCGRFSANNISELIPQINKTLEYEKFIMPDPDYLNNAVLIAGIDAKYANLYANGQMNYAKKYYFNSQNGFNTFYAKSPQSESMAQLIKDNINIGAGFVNYSAHGNWDGWVNPKLKVADVNTFTNKHKYGIFIGNACYTQSYNKNTCFGEALLRANEKGAVAYIGASAESYWDEDFWWATGFGNIDTSVTYADNRTLGAYDRIFHTHNEPFADWATTIAEFLMSGNMAVTESGSPDTHYYWEIYNLMGDPSLMPYLSKPSYLSINYDSIISPDKLSIPVYAEPFSYIALSHNDSLLATAVSDSTGFAGFDIKNFSHLKNCSITATRQNRIPHLGFILFSKSDSALQSPSNRKRNPDGFSIAENIFDLNAKVDLEKIILSWSAANNGLDFVIERSRDGNNYIEIGRIMKNAESHKLSDFTFTDENPYKDNNFYRLKQLDKDGLFRFYSHEPTIVKRDDGFKFTIYPNPSDGQNINLFIRKK